MKIIALILTLPCAALQAGDVIKEIKLTDGTVLKDVEVKDSTPRGVKLSHKDGIGIFRLDLLPVDLRKKYGGDIEAAKAAAKQKAEDAEKTARSVRRNAEASTAVEEKAKGVTLSILAVKQGSGFFRYFIIARNLTGDAMDGTLSVHYSSKFAPKGVGSRERKVSLAKDGASSGFIDWHTGPPCRHGAEPGLRTFEWTYKTKDGVEFTGSSPVPDKITERLTSDASMVD